MRAMTDFISESVEKFLKPIETKFDDQVTFTWANQIGKVVDQVKGELQLQGLSYDLLTVLVGDTITEEAAPDYESWLSKTGKDA